jgi:hypothetical protein
VADPVLTLPMTDSPSTLAVHHPLGASTGWLDAPRGDWPALVEQALEVSTFAVELAALDEGELPGVEAYVRGRPPLPFRYLSLHAPCKNRALPEAELVQRLGALRAEVDAIVVHPDTIEDPGRWRRLGATLVLENMDPRKRTGRTADELEPYFDALPLAGLCLDVAHAAAIGPDEGERLLDAHAGRLRHLHVSSLGPGCHHVRLDLADERAWAPLLRRCRDVPWILEAPLP